MDLPFVAGRDLPQMLMCSWQDTRPLLETVPFEMGGNIASQVAVYKQSHPELDMFDSTALSSEEALLEAAKQNAEKAISIAEGASAAAGSQAAPQKAQQSKAESWQPAERRNQPPQLQQPQKAEGITARPAGNHARTAIEDQLIFGAGSSSIRQAGSEIRPAEKKQFAANSLSSNAFDPSKIAAAMPQGRKGPPKAEARALSQLGKKQTTRPGPKGGHIKPAMTQNTVSQCHLPNFSACL